MHPNFSTKKGFFTGLCRLISRLCVVITPVAAYSTPLFFNAVEIRLPEGYESHVYEGLLSENGYIALTGNDNTIVRDESGAWHIPSTQFKAEALNNQGLVVGSASDSIVAWNTQLGPEAIQEFGEPGRSYSIRGIADDGTILIKSFPNYYLWKNGETTPFSSPSVSINTEHLYPVKLQVDGTIYGIYSTDLVTFNTFSITDGTLQINEAQTLTYLEADEINDISPNGNIVTFSKNNSVYDWIIHSPDTGKSIIEGNFVPDSVNDSGYVIGTDYNYGQYPDPPFANIWSKSTGVLNINNIILDKPNAHFGGATSINSKGELLATTYNSPEGTSIYLLKPVKPKDEFITEFNKSTQTLNLTATPLFENSSITLEYSENLIHWYPVENQLQEVVDGTHSFTISKPKSSTFYRVKGSNGE